MLLTIPLGSVDGRVSADPRQVQTSLMHRRYECVVGRVGARHRRGRDGQGYHADADRDEGGSGQEVTYPPGAIKQD
jgi:hypothetical protein